MILGRKGRTRLYALFAVTCWASAFVSTKYVLEVGGLSAMDLACLRYSLSGILLLMVLLFWRIPLPAKKDVWIFALAGFVGYSLYGFLFNTASQLINPSTASVVDSICPALTALLAHMILGEKISPKAYLALGISFSGIVLMSLWGKSFSMNVGVFYMLGGSSCLAAYHLWQRYLVQSYPPLMVMLYTLLFGSIFLFGSRPQAIFLYESMGVVVFLHLLYLAMFPCILAYYFWVKALQTAGSTAEVTNFSYCIPILATLFSIFFLGEVPALSTYLGGALVLVGMALFQKLQKRKEGS